MEVVLSSDPRDLSRRDWSALVTADPAGTFFHTPRFLKLYWEEFARGPEQLLLAFAEAGGEQVGAVAFEIVGSTLRFLGGTEVTDYMGPVALPEARQEVSRALLAALTGLDWAEADLRGLPEDEPWLGLLADAASEQGLSVDVQEDQNGVAPRTGVPGSFEEYLARLPPKLRHEIRRKARRLEADAGPWHICLATAEDLEPSLDVFVEMHRTSEGPKGVFMQPGMEIFFRRLGEALLPLGIFNLTFIELDREHRKLAGTIGFRYEGTYYLYNSAFDRAFEAVSPGMVLVAEDIRIAIEAGCSTFDMLKGDYAYKYRFGAMPRAIKRLVLAR